jgi:hypothetical protein
VKRSAKQGNAAPGRTLDDVIREIEDGALTVLRDHGLTWYAKTLCASGSGAGSDTHEVKDAYFTLRRIEALRQAQRGGDAAQIAEHAAGLQRIADAAAHRSWEPLIQHGRAMKDGPKHPRDRDKLAVELRCVFNDNPDITVDEVLAQWTCPTDDSWVQEVVDGVVHWHEGPGSKREHTTSRDTLAARLRRLRKARKHA